jgi:hypothetical protein
MEAGPRDTAQGTDHITADRDVPELGDDPELGDGPEQESDRLSSDGPDETQGVTDDGPEPEEMFAGEVEVELRPQRRLDRKSVV